MNPKKPLQLWPLQVLLVSFFLIISLRFLLTRPPIWNDEAIYADMSKNLLLEGRLKTSLFSDFIPQLDQYSFWYPPVYFYILTSLYFLFTPSIIVSRLLSLSLATACIFLSYLLFKQLNRYQKKQNSLKNLSWTIFLLLTVSSPYFLEGAVIGRMEIMVIFWGLLCLWQLLIFRQNNSLSNLLISGLAAGLAIFTHPNGIIFFAAINLELSVNLINNLIHKKNYQAALRNLFIFNLPSLVLASLWLIHIWPHKEIFFLQNKEQLMRKQHSTAFFINSLRFRTDRRYLLLANIAFYALAFWQLLKSKNLKHKSLLIFLFLLTAIWPILMKEMWYLLYFNFFANFAFALTIKNKQNNLFLKISALILTCIISLYINLNAIKQLTNNTDNYWQLCNNLVENIPQNSQVILASLPDPYFCLSKQRTDLSLKESPNTPAEAPINSQVYNKIFEQADYVVLSYFPNPAIAKYLQTNTEKVVFNNQDLSKNNYPVMIIQLKAVESRVPFDQGTP